jgi:peroxiredoxin
MTVPSTITTNSSNTVKNNRPAIVPIMIIGVVVLLFIGFTVALLKTSAVPPDTGLAPDFALTTYEGQPFKLSAQQGKITLINFWASWCNTCPGEAPILNTLWNDYQSKGVMMIGVAHLDNRDDSLSFMKQYTMRYPAAPDDGNHASDAYHIKQVPETYLVDQRGQIVYALHGPIDANSALLIRAKIDKLLASPPTGSPAKSS